MRGHPSRLPPPLPPLAPLLAEEAITGSGRAARRRRAERAAQEQERAAFDNMLLRGQRRGEWMAGGDDTGAGLWDSAGTDADPTPAMPYAEWAQAEIEY